MLAFHKKSGSRSSGELAAVFSDRLALAAVGTVRGWRPAGLGALAGLLLLALIVLALGPLLDRVPLHLLQLAIGVLLLLFGMRWLRKAILRAAGVIPLHDEERAYATETTHLREQERQHKARLDWVAALASFKAVVLEGLEVVFIVIAVGAGRGLIVPASVGAIAACLLDRRRRINPTRVTHFGHRSARNPATQQAPAATP
jgi:Ca2+/H+ antiporter, TMEM165/GDT1 family